MTSESKKKYECKYCNKLYTKESTLFAHMCEKKRRSEQEKEIGVQFGYQAYKKFLQMSQPQTTKKTYKDFAGSNYYLAFVRFGRHIKMINALKPERFIEYVIKSNHKLDHWCKDKVYDGYLVDLLKKENPNDTLQRALEVMIVWADEQNAEFNHYFKYESPNKICKQVINGRLSAWIVYNSDTGMDFLGSLNDDQLGLIYDYIDPEYWQTRFNNYLADTEYMKETLKETGL